MRVKNILRALVLFARARGRYGIRTREELERHQQRKLAHFLSSTLSQSPYYAQYAKPGATLASLPIVDKKTMMSDFAGFNTCGVDSDTAMRFALDGERTRTFDEMPTGMAVGLSSGTSGNKGIFLVSPDERLTWAAMLLARILSTRTLLRLLNPFSPPLRVAFFLRADNALYRTLRNARIDLVWHDLMGDLEAALHTMSRHNPEVVVAPASVLGKIAAVCLKGDPAIAPTDLISVAETLEPEDATAIRKAFDIEAKQIYQATEGLLACTCPCGEMHLNELNLHIEPEWLDDTHSRFHPIVTDFNRRSQIIARYRLDDIVRVSGRSCSCGSPERVIDSVEGRADEVLSLPRYDGALVQIFPDTLRHTILLSEGTWQEYSIRAEDMHNWHIALSSEEPERARASIQSQLETLFKKLAVIPPTLSFENWVAPPVGSKRRRIANGMGSQ